MHQDARLLVVVPVRGKNDVLAQCIDTLVTATQACSRASLVLVDNNEVGAPDPVLRRYADAATVLPCSATTVGGVRNAGVAVEPAATHFAFVDCDCLVQPSFCNDVLDIFQETGATIVGCKVVSPSDGHWTERVGDALHREGGDGPRQSMNSGCMAIDAEAFARIGGFDERLVSNEDYDLCARIRAQGGRIWQSERLQVIHLGNPKSVRGFMRRLAWHGKGIVRPDGSVAWSPMSVATVLNLGALVLGVSVGVRLLSAHRVIAGLAVLLLGAVALPAVFVVARMWQRRHWITFLPSVALMQLTFLARAKGLAQRLLEVRAAARSATT